MQKRRGLLSGLLLSLLVSLSACHGSRIDRREIPEAFRAQAATAAGFYAGPNGALRVDVVGSSLQVHYFDRAGHPADLLDPRCESQIGDLQNVAMTTDGRILSAEFSFDPNRCWGSVEGRTLKLDFAANRIRTAIRIRESGPTDCRIEIAADGFKQNGRLPQKVCGKGRILTSSKLFKK